MLDIIISIKDHDRSYKFNLTILQELIASLTLHSKLSI